MQNVPFEKKLIENPEECMHNCLCCYTCVHEIYFSFVSLSGKMKIFQTVDYSYLNYDEWNVESSYS